MKCYCTKHWWYLSQSYHLKKMEYKVDQLCPKPGSLEPLLKSLSEVLTIFQILRLWKPLGTNYGVMLKQLLVVILS